jgi:hypothetical protein
LNVSIMLWVTKSMFFSNLKTFFGKRTFINVLFWKIQNTFEKNDSLHSLRHPPSQSLRGYLYAADVYATMWRQWDHYAHVRMIAVILQKMGWTLGNVFLYNIGMAIFRDVFDFILRQITFYPPFLIHIYWNILRMPKSGHFLEQERLRKIRFMSQKVGSLFPAFSHFVYTTFSGIFWKCPKWASVALSFFK